ncbi:type IV pilus assembly protein PilM [Methyloparacoccus murrellii]
MSRAMFRFPHTPPRYLGVDISPSSVKVVELACENEQLTLKGYAIVPVAPADPKAKPREDGRLQLAGGAIRKAMRQLGTRLPQAVTAVPTSAVIAKILTFPASLNEDDIEAQIELEAEQYIPYPLEDVSLDFFVVGPSEKLPGSVDVQVVASRKEYVEDRAAALEWAGLRAAAVDVESFAMMRACARLMAQQSGDPDEVYAISDAGDNTTSLVVFHRQQMLYTREQTFGGRQLSEEIQRHYGIPREQAERARRYGGLPDDYETAVYRPFVEALGQQINRSLHLFRASQPQVNLTRLYLAGGCAADDGVLQAVDAGPETVVQRLDPFEGMVISPRAARPHLAREAPALLVATGLALRSFA